MHYDVELNFLRDTLRKAGVQLLIAELDAPLPKRLAEGIPPALYGQEPDTLPLRHFLPELQPATVYHLNGWFSCCYTYFLLPQLSPESVLVIGPYVTQQLSEQQLLEQAEHYQLDVRSHKRFMRYYSAVPVIPTNGHMALLLETFFDRLWGNGCYQSEIVHHTAADPSSLVWPPMQKSEEENLMTDMAIMEDRYDHENSLIEAVREGNMWRLDAFLSRISASSFEQRTADPLRNLKNYCIITNTLLRKAAEQGGVHPLYIDSLSSSFAQQIEQLSSTSEGTDMIVQMAKAYCSAVRGHTAKRYSPPVHKAILLINRDLSVHLTLSVLAQQININSSYLSALFKKETGSTVTEYITSQRIRHACSLLENSRLHIQTVAQHCGFEDIHYFSKLFKRHTGLSPKQYRQNAGR